MKDFFSNIEEMFHGKLHFLCSIKEFTVDIALKCNPKKTNGNAFKYVFLRNNGKVLR